MSVKIQARYLGGLRCEAVHGPSQAKLLTDAPKDNHGKGEAFSPTDLLGTALGTCMLTIMGIKAKALGVALEGTEVEVVKEMTAAPPRKVARLTVVFRLPAVATEHRAALEAAAHTCPVALSLDASVEKKVEFRWA